MKEIEQFIDFDQHKIYLKQWKPQQDFGNAPIILLHDSLGSVELWRDLPALLAEITNRAVIAYDRLGFGYSSALVGIPSLDFIELEAQTTFKKVIEHLGLNEFILMGHSVGGGMAACCAADYPTQTKALITIAAQSFVEDKTLCGIRDAKQLFSHPDQIKRLEKYHAEKARWVVNAWTETWCDPDFSTWELKSKLEHIFCSNLILHGELDEYGSTLQADNFKIYSHGDSELHILDGLHHMPHKENQTKILSLISYFLKNNRV